MQAHEKKYALQKDAIQMNTSFHFAKVLIRQNDRIWPILGLNLEGTEN